MRIQGAFIPYSRGIQGVFKALKNYNYFNLSHLQFNQLKSKKKLIYMNNNSGHSDNIKQLADEWLHHLTVKKYSQKTIQTYRCPLNRFLSYLEENHISRIQDVTQSDLERYRKQLVDCNFSGVSIELYMRSVRQFFRYLEDNGHLFINPANALIVSKPERRLPKVPTIKEITKLLTLPDTTRHVGIRDRAILEVAYCTGARLEELTRLTLFDPNLKNQTLRILGKGRKERIVPLGKHAIYWIETYMRTARTRLLDNNINEQGLWIGIHKRKLFSQAISVMIRNYGKKVKSKQSISPHSLRRACATHMLQNGAHPVQIQMLLGHADLKHLGQYLRLTITDLKKTHKNSKVAR